MPSIVTGLGSRVVVPLGKCCVGQGLEIRIFSFGCANHPETFKACLASQARTATSEQLETGWRQVSSRGLAVAYMSVPRTCCSWLVANADISNMIAPDLADLIVQKIKGGKQPRRGCRLAARHGRRRVAVPRHFLADADELRPRNRYIKQMVSFGCSALRPR